MKPTLSRALRTITVLAVFLSTRALMALGAGDRVTPDALAKAQWLHGKPPVTWEPGKVYFIECWATWCGPCVAAIPHMNDLHTRYEKKGLHVIGLDVLEDDISKVSAFVNKKGEGMVYPVAFVGKNGAFENDWLQAGKVEGIPHTFVVQDGKLILQTHPAKLTDKIVEGLLAGGGKQQEAIKQIQADDASEDENERLVGAASEAFEKNEREKMAAAVAELSKQSPDDDYLPLLRLELEAARGEWDAVEKNLTTLDPELLQRMIFATARCTGNLGQAPQSLLKKLAMAGVSEKSLAESSFGLIALAQVQWRAGQKDASRATVQSAIDSIKSAARNKEEDALPTQPFTRFAEELSHDHLPTDHEFQAWFR
ncbi:MAG: TlpA disulfide reductase family protein [Luteolibacter sp.]